MIAIDVMGGDFAPHVVLQGAVRAAREGCEICLFGPELEVIAWLDDHEVDWKTLPISCVNTTQTICMADEPVSAVRKKQDSSLVRAIESVASGRADAVVSAGNSGALMVAGVFVLGREKGVERPAIAGLFPTPNGQVVGLDLGANTDCKPHHLVQFAHLGCSFAKKMFGDKSSLRLALLANGEEDSKGSLLTKDAFQLLKSEPQINFIGNREPHDILGGGVDIFVCDGFTGNIFLKTFEAMLAEKINFFNKIVMPQALAVPGCVETLNRVMHQVQSANVIEQMGGALLVGLEKPIFVCHGAARAVDITQAIKTASKYVKIGKNAKNIAI